jgi:hypothetical protein
MRHRATKRFSSLMLNAMLHLLLVASVVGADEQNKKLVRMPVRYDQAMLVLVSPEGSGGVRFIEPFDKGNETGNGIVGISYPTDDGASNSVDQCMADIVMTNQCRA